MMRKLAIAGGLAAAMIAAALLVAWSGVVPVGASSGHWPMTEWFLHFAMRQSVKTWAGGAAVPDLDDPALALRGAGHYETACALCHGAPGRPPSLVTQRMTPYPPPLSRLVPTWRPEELFWIVKHGVKYTGMPAWPAQGRDDEVWAMVAFLRRLPGMDAAEYRRLAVGAAAPRIDTPGVAVADCARCHGPRGEGRLPGAVPRLAGQSEEYLFASLRAYAAGTRHSGIMQPVAAGLDEAALRALARHFSAQPTPPPQPADADLARRGEEIARRGIPARGVPACAQCHGPKEAPRNPIYPLLAGQYAGYLELQLGLFAEDRRGGTPFAHIMRTIAARLDPEDRRAVAAFYSGLAPEE